MWAVIVTNQGTPVQVTLVSHQDDLDAVVRAARKEWRLDHEKRVNVMERGLDASNASAGSVPVRLVTLYVDSVENAKYFLTVVPRIKTAKSKDAPKLWQFCPDCGCSWLHHLEGQASLEVEDWDPCPCSECGCKKAVNP